MQVHLAPAEVLADAKGRLEEALKVVCRGGESRAHFLPAQDLAPDRFFCESLVIHGTHP
jgi:hypothetical protein